MAKKYVAIFGRADAVPGGIDYCEALRCARIISGKGLSILTGGYGGVMEAASMGASEAGGESVGVVCGRFKGRSPNRFLTEAVETEDLFERQKVLVELASAYCAFEPGAGTLSEVLLVLALRKNGEKALAPMALVGEKWRRIIGFMRGESIIPENLLEYTFLFGDGEAAALFLAGELSRSGEASIG